MFENLTEKLQRTFKNLRGQGTLTEENIGEALKEIRMALLEADVNFKVVKELVDHIREKAVGQEVMTALSPAEQVVKIQEDPTKTIDDVRELVSGARGRANVMVGGDIDGGIWSAGQSQGLIHDIPTCEVLVKRIMKQAEDIIHARLDRMAPGKVAATA